MRSQPHLQVFDATSTQLSRIQFFLSRHRHAWPKHHAMTELSRETSHQSALADDASSLTPFPQLSPSASHDHDSTNQPLNGLLEGSGPSMFDDNTATDASDPQTLSTASTEVLRNIIDHHGAIELIRRLSTMLAERDAHITALTRLAEDYKIPRGQINDTASRVKQSERRRLSLATASEDLAPSSGLGSESGVCYHVYMQIEVWLIGLRSLNFMRGLESHLRHLRALRNSSEEVGQVPSHARCRRYLSSRKFGCKPMHRGDVLTNLQVRQRHQDQLLGMSTARFKRIGETRD